MRQKDYEILQELLEPHNHIKKDKKMRISVDFLWALTKWLIVIAVAYFVFTWFDHPKEDFVPGNTSLYEFNYNNVNPNYQMNVILRSGKPIQIDSIIAKSNGQVEYYNRNGTWCLMLMMEDGSTRLLPADSVLYVYFVKKGDKPG
jgi:hypothetical protein